jgi:hypothetical protein
MPENIRSKSGLFADDTIVYLTITSDIDSVNLQNDLNKLARWEERWCGSQVVHAYSNVGLTNDL